MQIVKYIRKIGIKWDYIFFVLYTDIFFLICDNYTKHDIR
jgi:hypothetical protein